MVERRCVVVAGFPRSGTSWLAKGLSFAPGFTYYREPDNFNFVPGAEERFTNLYLTAEHDDAAYRRLMTRAAAGEVATALEAKEYDCVVVGAGLRIVPKMTRIFETVMNAVREHAPRAKFANRPGGFGHCRRASVRARIVTRATRPSRASMCLRRHCHSGRREPACDLGPSM
jgi:hypothetical protein